MIIKEALAELEFKQNPVAKILHTSDTVKIIVLAFKKGMVLKEHKTAISAKLLVIDGKVKYLSSVTETILNLHDEFLIPINELHAVEAIEDSVCLLIKG